METTEKRDRPCSPAWKSLLGRAVMSLDDDALSAYRKSRADMEAKLVRIMGERGLASPPFDFYMVQEVLVEYDRCGVLSEAIEACGGKESECVEAGKFDADIRLVWKFVQDGVRDRLRARALDYAQIAQKDLGDALSDEKNKYNPKLLKMALEGTVPEIYGGGSRASGGDDDADEKRGRLPMSGGILINIQGDAAAKLVEPPAPGRAGGVFIDV